MKDSARRLLTLGIALTLTAAALAAAACAKSSKTSDVAQDSMLVKDVDLAKRGTDTTTAPATLVRDRGSAADLPSLTSGAPVKRSPASSGVSQTGLQPPARVNPTPVLPGRDSTVTDSQPTGGTSRAIPPTPVPTKKDSTRDSVNVNVRERSA